MSISVTTKSMASLCLDERSCSDCLRCLSMKAYTNSWSVFLCRFGQFIVVRCRVILFGTPHCKRALDIRVRRYVLNNGGRDSHSTHHGHSAVDIRQNNSPRTTIDGLLQHEHQSRQSLECLLNILLEILISSGSELHTKNTQGRIIITSSCPLHLYLSLPCRLYHYWILQHQRQSEQRLSEQKRH